MKDIQNYMLDNIKSLHHSLALKSLKSILFILIVKSKLARVLPSYLRNPCNLSLSLIGPIGSGVPVIIISPYLLGIFNQL